MNALHRPVMARISALVTSVCVLAGCSSVGLGISLPIPGIGSIGVGVNSDGRLSAGVSVGTGGISVGVGGTAQLPPRDPVPARTAPEIGRAHV